MRKKLFVATMIFSVVLLGGCISSDTPTDRPIILNKDNLEFNLVVRSDYSEVTWTFDGGSPRTDRVGDGNNTASYLLEYKNIPVGSHTLKVEDGDDQRTWQIEVQGTEEEQAQYSQQSAGNETSYYPSWEEQIRKAQQRNKK